MLLPKVIICDLQFLIISKVLKTNFLYQKQEILSKIQTKISQLVKKSTSFIIQSFHKTQLISTALVDLC
jgi:hypothetical protein